MGKVVRLIGFGAVGGLAAVGGYMYFTAAPFPSSIGCYAQTQCLAGEACTDVLTPYALEISGYDGRTATTVFAEGGEVASFENIEDGVSEGAFSNLGHLVSFTYGHTISRFKYQRITIDNKTSEWTGYCDAT